MIRCVTPHVFVSIRTTNVSSMLCRICRPRLVNSLQSNNSRKGAVVKESRNSQRVGVELQWHFRTPCKVALHTPAERRCVETETICFNFREFSKQLDVRNRRKACRTGMQLTQAIKSRAKRHTRVQLSNIQKTVGFLHIGNGVTRSSRSRVVIKQDERLCCRVSTTRDCRSGSSTLSCQAGGCAVSNRLDRGIAQEIMGVNDTHSSISWIIQRGRSGRQSGLRHGSTTSYTSATSYS